MYLTDFNADDQSMAAQMSMLDEMKEPYKQRIGKWKHVEFDDTSDRDSLFFEVKLMMRSTIPMLITMRRQYINLTEHADKTAEVGELSFGLDGMLVTARACTLIDQLIYHDVVDSHGPTNAKKFAMLAAILAHSSTEDIVTDMSRRHGMQAGRLGIDAFTSTLAIMDDSISYTWGYGSPDDPHGWNAVEIVLGLDFTHDEDDEGVLDGISSILAMASGAQRGVLATP